MLKLMKYEFRKLRTTLLCMLAALAALEIAFLAGLQLHKNAWISVSVVLLTLLGFAVYAYIILAGMTSYSRELKEKSGYLIFMTPVSPLGVVLSKLLFTALTALVATALFGIAAFYDIRLLVTRLDLDPKTLDQINMMLRLGLKANATVQQILQQVGFWTLTVLIEVILTMCTAYLAITLSATLLQNKKGFLRGLISVVLFVALSWGSGWLAQKLLYNKVAIDATFEQMRGVIGWSLLLNAVLCALFVAASAWLLDRKVNL